jgi:hypothetical protein
MVKKGAKMGKNGQKDPKRVHFDPICVFVLFMGFYGY